MKMMMIVITRILALRVKYGCCRCHRLQIILCIGCVRNVYNKLIVSSFLFALSHDDRAFSSILIFNFSHFFLFSLPFFFFELEKVKVWFQNRRTKHKRMAQEDETKGEGSNHSNNLEGSYDDEEEMIDMEMDDCSSEDEHGIQH